MSLKKWLYETLGIPHNQQQEQESDAFRLLRMLLLKTDGHFFADLKQCQNQVGNFQQQYALYVCHFQRYLTKKQLKRLKNGYEMQLRQSKDVNKLLKVALYMGINSHLRKEIVDKIVSFSQEQQRQLMKAIKEIQKECQQVLEIKKIIERVQLLQASNQQLKASLQQKSHSLKEEIVELNEIQQENKVLFNQIQRYTHQKIQAFSQLGSVEMQDFSYCCRKIKDQIFNISYHYEELNTQHLHMQKNNARLKQDLKFYGKTIKQYIDQLDKLKRQHMLTNQEFVLRDISHYVNNQALITLPLIDFKNRINLNVSIDKNQRKLDTERTNCDSQQDSSFSFQQKKCSLGLLLQISQLQKEIEEKLEIVKQLKQIQQSEKDKNRKLTKKLQKIKYEHHKNTNQLFMSSLRSMTVK